MKTLSDNFVGIILPLRVTWALGQHLFGPPGESMRPPGHTTSGSVSRRAIIFFFYFTSTCFILSQKRETGVSLFPLRLLTGEDVTSPVTSSGEDVRILKTIWIPTLISTNTLWDKICLLAQINAIKRAQKVFNAAYILQRCRWRVVGKGWRELSTVSLILSTTKSVCLNIDILGIFILNDWRS